MKTIIIINIILAVAVAGLFGYCFYRDHFKKEVIPFYTFTIDATDSTLRYNVYDGNETRFVGSVSALQLDSLMDFDNQ